MDYKKSRRGVEPESTAEIFIQTGILTKTEWVIKRLYIYEGYRITKCFKFLEQMWIRQNKYLGVSESQQLCNIGQDIFLKIL